MPKRKQPRPIPRFRSEDEERDFWATHDVTDYFDMSKPIKHVAFPNLKFSTRSISLRLPVHMLERLKMLANKRDVPYQSYIKVILDERIREEMK